MGVSKVHLTVLCACRSQDEIFTTNWGLRGTSNAEGRVGGHGRDRCGGVGQNSHQWQDSHKTYRMF